MRILFLTPRPLDDPRSGGTIKSAAVLTYLARSHEVHMGCFVLPGVREPLLPGGRSFCLPLERPRSMRRLLASYARGVPLSIERNRSAAFRTATEKALADVRPDAIFVDGWLMAQYVPAGYGGLKLLHEHNAEHLMWRRQLALERGRLRRLALRLEAERVRRYESGILKRFDAVFAVSEPDRRALAAIGAPRERVHILPNVADAELLSRPPLTPSAEPVVLFLGTLSWPPNAEGLAGFLRGAFPALHELMPQAKLVVAGADAPPSLLRLGRRTPGVRIVGPVDDDESLYRSARCFVDVSLGGGGTRVKILNALARGLPVVATSDAAAGLDVISGEHLLVADGTAGLADALARAFADDALWTGLSERGRELVRTRYVPEVAFCALDEVLGEAAPAGT